MILVLKDQLFGLVWVFNVTSTDQVPEKTILYRAGHTIAIRLGDPEVAVTLKDVLTLPEEIQHAIGFHSEEITDKHRDVNGEILIPSNAEVHYCHEYLVKPLQVREREIEDFIMGYTTALHNKTAHTACGCEEKYNVSRQTAKQWAHIFLKDGYAVLSTFIEKMADENEISFEMEGELT